ncbi:MAG: DUF362 domain-containing protein [bacterium]
MKTKVYIEDATEIRHSIGKLFDAFGLNDLKNRRVFVKPNMLRIAQPEECIITDPQLIEWTVDYLLKKGAILSVGDNPIPQPLNEIEVARKCGFLKASKGHFKNIGRYVKKIKLKHKSVKEIYVSRDILDAEILISLPKFKTHELTILSIAIKNHFGIIPGGIKPHLHAQCASLDDFCKLLFAVYNQKKSDLIIVDAINVRDANNHLFRPNKVIVGNDPWAIEYVCSLMAGLKPNLHPLLKMGLKERLFDPDDFEVLGTLEPIKGFSLPAGLFLRNLFSGTGSRLFARIQDARITYIDHLLCNRCRACENVCPTRAINNFKIDNKKCIKCYCCFEVCPTGAIKKKLKII